ncbi:MarR family transcriptional regulator [Pseudomonas sp. R2.Fl]|nr:MarR family transcriptional regulator [Pseudomonas sp. R2.Fl]
MADNGNQPASLSAWTKRCYFAARELMDATLRPFDLGSTQWYVLRQLAIHGPTVQRDLVRMLDIERATLSGVASTLVRKGLISQSADDGDQRQRLLCLTETGQALWDSLPDLRFIQETAFGGIDPAEIETATRVLRSATERLQHVLEKGKSA